MFSMFSVFDAKIKIILQVANEKNMFNSIYEPVWAGMSVFYAWTPLDDGCICMWVLY